MVSGQARASSTGSGIGSMPTQTSSRWVTGSWKRENNIFLSLNYRENPGHAPGIISASSTILEAFFFTVELWEMLVQETNAHAARTTPSGWYDTC